MRELSPGRREQQNKAGAPGGSVRCVLHATLAVGARRGWKAGTTDIKGAFLNAPLLQRTKHKTERIILDPPKILSRAGIIPPHEKWLVTRALYGLDISPKSWAVFRNQQLNGRRFLSGGAELDRKRQSVIDAAQRRKDRQKENKRMGRASQASGSRRPAEPDVPPSGRGSTRPTEPDHPPPRKGKDKGSQKGHYTGYDKGKTKGKGKK